MFKQQVEAVLNDGFDFISIIITQGPSDNFLNAVRRVGAYQLMSYYWGADYSDPETEVYPFYQEAGDRGTFYSFLRTAFRKLSDGPCVMMMLMKSKPSFSTASTCCLNT